MLSEVVNALDIPRDFWPSLAGCSPKQMDEWIAGQRQVPLSVARRISAAVGVPVESIVNPASRITGASPGNTPSTLPPLWLKARDEKLAQTSVMALAVTRLLVSKYDEAVSLLEEAPGEYKQLLNDIRGRVDLQATPEIQGQVAADAFLKLTGLGQGARPIGEVLRGALRNRGLLVIETPINDKTLEGFCIPVGAGARARPCLLANSFTTTWFRRNEVLLHELGHAIFDLEGAFALFDVKRADDNFQATASLAEERASSFALHALLPRRLLVAVGLNLTDLSSSSSSVASIIGETHAEQGLIARAAVRHGLLSEEEADRFRNVKVSQQDLIRATPHARGLASLSKEELADPRVREWESRKTTFPISGVRLPIPFVQVVLRALDTRKITPAKAAELLMVTTTDLSARYGVPGEEEPEGD
jgi:Zn-dependent peptidase ImmA (M78 family)